MSNADETYFEPLELETKSLEVLPNGNGRAPCPCREHQDSGPKFAVSNEAPAWAGEQPVSAEVAETDFTAGIERAARMSSEPTDWMNAQRLIVAAEGNLRWCDDHSDGWVWFDGQRWVRESGGVAMRLMSKVALRMGVVAVEEGDSRLAKFATESRDKRRLTAALALAKDVAGVCIKADEFDADPGSLGVANGTFDLRSGELLKPDRQSFMTLNCGVTFDWNATCPTWEGFLGEVTDSNPGLCQFLQQAVGYTLSGGTEAQHLFLLYGTGANGKSVFLETISALTGDYGKTTSFETFLANQNGNQTASYNVATLKGARFVNACEVEPGRSLSEGLVKAVTGSDTVSARHPYGRPFSYKPTFKLWLAANHRPTVRGADHGLWRRVWLVPFTVTIPEERQDPDLAEKLKAELPGILKWAVVGYRMYLAAGFKVPVEVTTATQEYREDMDTLADFVRDRCEVGPECSATTAALFDAYCTWATPANVWKPLSKRGLSEGLRERGYVPVRTKAWRGWQGIAPRDVLGDAGDTR